MKIDAGVGVDEKNLSERRRVTTKPTVQSIRAVRLRERVRDLRPVYAGARVVRTCNV